jgi:hypothetical protein
LEYYTYEILPSNFLWKNRFLFDGLFFAQKFLTRHRQDHVRRLTGEEKNKQRMMDLDKSPTLAVCLSDAGIIADGLSILID